MTAEQLYQKLYELGIEFEIVEIFDGVRILNIEVEEVRDE